MNVQTALNNLYNASRLLNESAETHDLLKQSAEVLQNLIDKTVASAKKPTEPKVEKAK